jgi:hypothetical protein
MKVEIIETLPTHPRKIVFNWKTTGYGAAWATTAQGYAGSLLSVVTIPGVDAVKPTANYAVALLDEHDVDLFNGAGANRSDTATEQMRFPVGVALGVVVDSKLTLTITGAGAQTEGMVIVYLD